MVEAFSRRLRVGSPGFGKSETVRLDDQGQRAVFLAECFGHGFMALSEQATVLYLCSTRYAAPRLSPCGTSGCLPAATAQPTSRDCTPRLFKPA
jgi:hypothetical protein